MIFDVAVYHTVEFVPKGKRRHVTELCKTVVPFQVGEFSAEDAPVVMWRRKRPSGPQTAVRMHDGKFYEPFDCDSGKNEEKAEKSGLFVGREGLDGFCRDSSGVPVAKKRAPLVLSVEGLRGYLQSTFDDVPGMRHNIGEAVAVPDAAVVVRNDLESVWTSVSDRIGAVMIEGVAHREIGRPVLQLSVEYPAKISATDASDHLELEGAYPAEDFDEALAVFSSAQKRANWDEDYRPLRPDVVRPDLLAFDKADWLVRGAARNVVEWMSHNSSSSRNGWASRLSEHGRETIVAFIRLRDALRSEAPYQEMVELLGAYGQTLPESDYRWEGEAGKIARIVSRAEAIAAEAVNDADLACLSGGF